MPRPLLPSGLLAAALALAAGLPSCVIVDSLGWVRAPESNDWNLTQLHKPSGSYNYTADLVTDLQYLVRSNTGKLPVKTSEERKLGNRKKVVEDPAEATLENVLELADFEPDTEYVAGLQVMWFCRLALDDPSALVRERCALELGPLGERVAIGRPAGLPPGVEPAGPDELGEPLTELIREFRLTRERGAIASADVAALDAACDALAARARDVAGGRRVLYTTGQLLRGLGRRDPARAPLERLSRDVQKRSIEGALARALVDEAGIVRAAAVEATVRATGPAVLGPILLQLDREPSERVIVRVLELVAERGLPGPVEGMDPADYARARETLLSILYALAVNHPEGHVRVHAMRALAAACEPGVDSLREEDWERWWLAREAGPGQGRGT